MVYAFHGSTFLQLGVYGACCVLANFSTSRGFSCFSVFPFNIFQGTSGDSLTWHDGLPFSTKDRDSGDCHNNSCAFLYHGAWWYGDSFQSNLNGKYYSQVTSIALDGIIWQTWRDLGIPLKKTEMKVRRYI